MQILIVEDDADARDLLSLMLGSYDVTAVASVEEAKAALVAVAPDLIVCDVRLGGETGMSLVNEVASRGQEIPFVLISGFVGEHGDDSELIKSYLAKPFRAAELLRAVEDAMGTTD